MDEIEKKLKYIKELCVKCDTTNTNEVNVVLCEIIDICNEMI